MMGCTCGSDCKVTLLYACSGAANTGLLADQVARTLMGNGKGSMTCLAAVGADLSGFLASARSASQNVVLDGCKVACGAKIFTSKGIPFTHLVMTDFGVVKGQTPVTGELIEDVAAQIAQRI